MKKLTVILSEDDFRTIAGALFKTNANFQVETIEEPPVRHVQRRTADGMSCADKIIEYLSGLNPKRATLSTLTAQSHNWGFHHTTIRGNVAKLTEQAVLKADGNWIILGG